MKGFPSVFESIKDLSVPQIHRLLNLARTYKDQGLDFGQIPKPFLHRPLVATCFLEHSTRTMHSFGVALDHLGATHINFDAQRSSLAKGEDLEQTLLTLRAQGFHLAVIRTPISQQLAPFKSSPPIKIINGGDGQNEHPTQALLDLFTMIEIGMPLKNQTIAIIGDGRHSRVTHSLIELLPQFGCQIILCGPEEFLPQEPLPTGVQATSDMNEALEKASLLYLLRIQKERHESKINFDVDHYATQYGLNLERVDSLSRRVPVFHPGPCNIDVEISRDLIQSKYYFGHEQVKHSIPMRMAIIQAVLQNGEKEIKPFESFRTLDSLQ